MTLVEVVHGIPEASRESLSGRLLDILLRSGKGDLIPIGLARVFLSLAQRGLLATEEGLRVLLEATAFVEPEKAAASLETDFGLRAASDLIRKMKAV